MNINAMGASSLSGRYPSTLSWTPLDEIVWAVRQVFLAGTARGLLEMLFGAGMVLLATNALRTDTLTMAVRRYYVRTVLLAIIGVIHVVWLGWFGDFLHIYGLVALVVFPLTRLRARWQMAIGLAYVVALALGGVASVVTGTPGDGTATTAPLIASTPGNAVTDQAVPDHARGEIATEDRERSATPARWSAAIHNVYATHFDWGWVRHGLGEAGATMLIGAALFKRRVLQGERGRAFYWRLAVAGYAVGVAIRVPGAWHFATSGLPMPLLDGLSEIGRLGMTLGHVAVLALVLGTPRGRAWLAPLQAVGRVSLSVYLCQTLLCLWLLFSPLGLGLYGRMGWTGLIATAAVVDVGLVVAANRYLRHWRTGPVEWAWRSLAASHILPLRVVRPVAETGATPLR
jgi:uncharacterized protein